MALFPFTHQDPEGRLVDRSSQPGSELYTDGDGRRVRRYADGAQPGLLLEEVQLRDGSSVVRSVGVGAATKLFIPQNLADIAWAFSDRNHKDERLFGLIALRCAFADISGLSAIRTLGRCWLGYAEAFSHLPVLVPFLRLVPRSWYRYFLGAYNE